MRLVFLKASMSFLSAYRRRPIYGSDRITGIRSTNFILEDCLGQEESSMIEEVPYVFSIKQIIN